MSIYKVLGMMSGTSLDGMDLCYCSFEETDGKWHYEIIKAITIEYPDSWLENLQKAPFLSAQELLLLDFQYGKWIGQQIKSQFNIREIDFISSHGHTIFHQPEKGFTFQLGNGQSIALESQCTTICDFRTRDVLMGGNGAPLVPVGDKHLFPEFSACVNLGGFANISYTKNKLLKAFDICPTNIILNQLSSKLGFPFDKNGRIAKSGMVDEALLDNLNRLPFYERSAPKSLGREWLEENVRPLVGKSRASTSDQLRTFTEHIATQVANVINNEIGNRKILFTGGGSKNSFLMERISKLSIASITLPSRELMDFKEALIFAFLGVLQTRGEINVIASVTGASIDSCSGQTFKP